MAESGQGGLATLSDALASAVERAAASTVSVNARRRMPASGIAFEGGVIVTADHVIEREDEIAVSVLASVIGHNRQARAIILDAGALALSKDIGASKHLPGAGYGYVCDAQSLRRLGGLAVDVVHQEHGTVTVDDESWFERLPIGSLVRILPNHACLTCAGYDAYHVLRGAVVVDRWARINGW